MPVPARSRGFTLLELMVALALMVLLAGLVMTGAGGSRGPSAEDELARLRAVVALASEQAVLQGDDLGIGFTADGYRLYRRGPASWRPLAEPRAYRPHRFAGGLSVALGVDGEPVVVPAAAPPAPQVVLWSSGEMTPFELVLGDRGRRQRLAAGADGSLSARSAAPAP
jgi:general secretion pathway protein H